MKVLGKFLNFIFYKGGIVPIGVLCVALFHTGKLPNYMGPVGYGITALGTCGLVRYIIMDVESDKCDKMVGEMKDKKLTLKKKLAERNSAREISEYIARKRNQLQGFQQDSARLDDKISSREQIAVAQRTENPLVTNDQSNLENQDLPEPASWRKNACEAENELKYYKNIERYHNMQMQDILEEQQMKMLYREMHIKKGATSKDNALIIYLEKAEGYFTDELENISRDLKNMSEDVLKLENEANPYGKTILQVITKKRREPTVQNDAAIAIADENSKGVLKENTEMSSAENVEKQERTVAVESKGTEEEDVERKFGGEISIQCWEKVELELKTAGRLVEIEIRGKVVESDERIDNKLKKSTAIKTEKIDNLGKEEELDKEKTFKEYDNTEQEKNRRKCETQQVTEAKHDLKMVERKTGEANMPDQKIEVGLGDKLKFKFETNVEKPGGNAENVEMKEKNVNLVDMTQENVKDVTKERNEGNLEETKQKRNENLDEVMQKRKDVHETKASGDEGSFSETMEKRNERNVEEVIQEIEDLHDKTTQEKENEVIEKPIHGDVHLEEIMEGKCEGHPEEKLHEKTEYLKKTTPEKELIEGTVPEGGRLEVTVPEGGRLEVTMPKRDGCLEGTMPEKVSQLEGTMPEREDRLETMPETEGRLEETMPERDSRLEGTMSEREDITGETIPEKDLEETMPEK